MVFVWAVPVSAPRDSAGGHIKLPLLVFITGRPGPSQANGRHRGTTQAGLWRSWRRAELDGPVPKRRTGPARGDAVTSKRRTGQGQTHKGAAHFFLLF
jgi:hypothetical protein